jgi:hydroxyethylthiazole kinase-like uncharacterized protein yjeF
MKIVSAEQMRNIDRLAAEAGITTDFLMENAGRGVAEETRTFAGGVIGKQVLAIAGPGNNGGDVLVAARYLQEWGAVTQIYLLSSRSGDDSNLAKAGKQGIPLIYAEKDIRLTRFKKILSTADIVIDGILGTGRARLLEGAFKKIITFINQAKQVRQDLTVVAADIPTGLNADTGEIDPVCLRADLTVTLGLPKPGLYNFPGAEYSGRVVISDIGIPVRLSKNISVELISSAWANSVLPARPASANKGTFGRVLAVVGSENYVGAAYLACMGAARAGAGVVTLSMAKSLQPILASKLTEVTYAPLPESEKGMLSEKAAAAILSIISYYRVLLIGCGLGQHPHTRKFVKGVLFNLPSRPPAIVLDADALNILAEEVRWWRRLPPNTILTPHAGEMARLTGRTIEEIQRDRLSSAREAARTWGKVVVLKGAYSVIAGPKGTAMICDIANAGLASAGTGDVLAGIIAGLAGQNMPLFHAAALGVYLHGKAGELVGAEMGNAGMLASDLLPALPRVIKTLH